MINEIHYDPTNVADRVEFVELYNPDSAPVDLSGWFFDKGAKITFPAGTTIDGNDYLVVTQNKPELIAKFGTAANKVFQWDDGASTKLSNQGEEIRLRRSDNSVADFVEYEVGGVWPTTGILGYSIQLVNPILDNNQAGAWRRQYPNPGAQNGSVFNSQAANMAVYNDVKQSPKQPTSSDTPTITIGIPQAPPGMTVTMTASIVTPGNYLSSNDSPYFAISKILEKKEPGKWSVELPSLAVAHRNLIRYRIQIMAPGQAPITIPDPQSPVPNFAMFIYDGISKYGDVDLSTLEQVPVYHLIAKQNDILNWIEAGRGNDWSVTGTLVHDGKVYDHIRFRAKGRGQRHERIKHNIKFKSNKGSKFEHRGDNGEKKSDKGTLMIYGGTLAGNEGIETGRMDGGLSEGVALSQFNLLGAPAAGADWIHFRVIDSAEENPADPTQGDFWGVFNIVSDYDGDWLKDQGLAQDYIYEWKDFGAAEFPPEGPFTNENPLFDPILSNRTAVATEEFWREHYNLPQQYRFIAVNESLMQQEHAYWGKHYHKLTHTPEGWFQMPSDMDYTMLETNGFGKDIFRNAITAHAALEREYHNQMRSFVDLFYGSDGMQTFIEEKAVLVHTPGAQTSLALLDWDRWGLTSTNLHRPNPPTYDEAKTSLQDFFTHRSVFLREISNTNAVPDTPAISLLHNNFASDTFTLEATPFSDPNASPFAAIQWQVAEYTPLGSYPEQGDWHYEVKPTWRSEPLAMDKTTISVPVGVIWPNRTYRARVRYLNEAGHWSHWSPPQTFSAEKPLTSFEFLMFSEIHYHPAVEDGMEEHEREFLEIHNAGEAAIDLEGFRVMGGVYYRFPEGASIPAGGYLVLAGDAEEFERHYGFAPDHEFEWKLSNDGETIALYSPWGAEVDKVKYDDNTTWGKGADGHGNSLELFYPDRDNNHHSAWIAVGKPDGSPGAPHSATCASGPPPDIQFTEINYNPEPDAGDWVEIRNNSGSPIDVGGWRFSDGGGSYTLPAHSIAPGEYMILVEHQDQFETVHPGIQTFGPFPFFLNNKGEALYLFDQNDCLVDSVHYDDNLPWDAAADGNGASLSLAAPGIDNENPWAWIADVSGGTPGADNGNNSPCSESPPQVVITEMNVDSTKFADPGDWIEIYNPTPDFADLSGWRLYDEGGRFDLPHPTWLAPGAHLILAEDSFAFASVHPNVQHVINGQGFQLRNQGERIVLTTPTGCVVQDIEYANIAPWPTGLGTGGTLQLLNPNLDNTQPEHWILSDGLGTPGQANDLPACPDPTGEAILLQATDNGSAVEFQNLLNQPLDVSGWHISGQGFSVQLPTNTIAAALATIRVIDCYVADDDFLVLANERRCPVDQVQTLNGVVNHAPKLQANAFQLNEGDTQNVQLIATDPDVGQSLSFTLGPNAPSYATLSPEGMLHLSPDEADGPATDEITIHVTDNFNPPATDSLTFPITIGEVNQPPKLNNIGIQTLDEQAPWTYTLRATDNDIPSQQLTYTLQNAPAGMDINGETISWTPTADQAGVYTITVTVSDGVAGDTTDVTLMVNNVNNPPQFANALTTTPPPPIFEGTIWRTSVYASDTDNDPVTYSLQGAPPGMAIHPQTGEIAWLAPVGTAGTHSFTVVASDPSLDSASKPMSIDIQDMQQPVTGGCPTPEMIFDTGTDWSYANTATGNAWKNPFSPDASMPSGPSPLGYGESVATSTPGGTTRTVFTKTFTLEKVHELSTLTLSIRRDDAAIIYLNGYEVARDNLPEGPIDETTKAARSMFGAAETVYHDHALPVDKLAEGENVIAIGVHQVTPSSNDMIFDAKLSADRLGTCDTITIDRELFLQTGTIQFNSQPGQMYELQCCDNLNVGMWIPLGQVNATDSMTQMVDPEQDPDIVKRRVYRIQKM